jgi:hypothetical protein
MIPSAASVTTATTTEITTSAAVASAHLAVTGSMTTGWLTEAALRLGRQRRKGRGKTLAESSRAREWFVRAILILVVVQGGTSRCPRNIGVAERMRMVVLVTPTTSSLVAALLEFLLTFVLGFLFVI